MKELLCLARNPSFWFNGVHFWVEQNAHYRALGQKLINRFLMASLINLNLSANKPRVRQVRQLYLKIGDMLKK